MNPAVERLKTEIATLSEVERADLAYYLLHSLEPDEGLDIEAAWNAEVARRADEIRARSVTGKPAEQVLAEIRASHT